MIFTRRTRRLGAVALGATILCGAAAATVAANPAGAAGFVSAVTTVSCSVTGANWCISGNNSGSGIGVIGTSKSGTGPARHEHLAVRLKSDLRQRHGDPGADNVRLQRHHGDCVVGIWNIRL